VPPTTVPPTTVATAIDAGAPTGVTTIAGP
jgi:hypothetical protein